MISVIVPIYKVEEYLNRCINSILNQTFQDFEVILVDDGSPDKCPELCDQWALLDKRIKVIHKENGGLSDARNYGIRNSVGEFLVFIDSDDWISENYLEYMWNVMQESGCDIIECDMIKTETDNITEHDCIKYKKSPIVFGTENALGELIKDGVFHQYVWNKLYKREVIDNIWFEKGKTNEDEFWTYQVFGNANLIAKINVPLYFYFQRNTSIMGVSYSIKRLDSLEAKLQRQIYIETNFPKLKSFAKINLLMSCVYQGQMILLNLNADEFIKAKKSINDIVKKIYIPFYELKDFSKSTKFWVCATKISFWETCKIRNFLKKGF